MPSVKLGQNDSGPLGEIRALILKLINTWGPPLENKERLTAAFIIFLRFFLSIFAYEIRGKFIRMFFSIKN